MQEKIEVNIPILTLVVIIDDCRHLSADGGETWGFYPVRCEGSVLEVNYDLIAIDGKEYLL